MPTIDRLSSTPFYQQIYKQIADGIDTGLYPPGKRLPSIRECARELDVSNTTIELAYQRLVAEGYVSARRGSGYTICDIAKVSKSPEEHLSDAYRKTLAELDREDELPKEANQMRYDFAYDAVDQTLFPFTTWARISREVFFDEPQREACLYNDRQGLLDLRKQIAHYLASEYGVNAHASQILIMPTTRDLIASILGLFEPSETTISMEEPGYNEITYVLRKKQFSIRSIPLYDGLTWDEAEPILAGANIVFCTPASQFPTNRTMPLEYRKELLKWANANNALIIDDEYGWEYQSGPARIPSIAAMDTTGRVVTLGTFSNVFTPAICLSYAVLPPWLMLRWRERERGKHPQVPWQTQAAMTAFMKQEHWRTHVRKMRTSMFKKRDALVSALEKHFGDRIEIVSGHSSLFVLVQMLDGTPEQELIDRALAAGVRVYPTNCFFDGEVPDTWHYMLVGFAGIPLEDIEPGVAALAKAWA